MSHRDDLPHVMILERPASTGIAMEADLANLASLTLDEQSGIPPSTFLALPEALRLLIYEHLDAPVPANGSIPLSPLPNAKLRTCRQVYTECLPIYRTGCDIYYSSSHFDLILDASISQSQAEERILSIPEQDFDKIANLTTTALSSRPIIIANRVYTLIHPHTPQRRLAHRVAPMVECGLHVGARSGDTTSSLSA
nr:hypothetical protein B0A51_09195 [Rachicladosporium sp. CCFEE 5018]